MLTDLSYSSECLLKSIGVDNVWLYKDSDFMSVNVLSMKLFVLSGKTLDIDKRDEIINEVLAHKGVESGMYFRYPIKYILGLFDKFKDRDTLVSLFRESVDKRLEIRDIISRFEYLPYSDKELKSEFLKCIIAYTIGPLNKGNKCIKSKRLLDNYYDGYLSDLSDNVSHFIQEILENVEYMSCRGFIYLVRCAVTYLDIEIPINFDKCPIDPEGLWKSCYEEASYEYNYMYNFYIDDIAMLGYETFSFDDYTKNNENYSNLTKDEFLGMVLQRVSDYIGLSDSSAKDLHSKLKYSDLEDAKRFIFKLCLHTCLSLDVARNVNYFILSNKAIQDYLKANPSGIDHKLENTLFTLKWLYNSRDDSLDILDMQKLMSDGSSVRDLIAQKDKWFQEDDNRWRNCLRIGLILLSEEIRTLNLKSSKLLDLSGIRKDIQSLIKSMDYYEGGKVALEVLDDLQCINYITLDGLQYLFKFYYEIFSDYNYTYTVSKKVEEIFEELYRKQEINNTKAADIFFGKDT